jgi:hypothetical protein
MALSDDALREIVAELVTRPGHEKVRYLVSRLLSEGLGASSTELRFEMPLPEVRGRLDALLGRTVLEFKRDLRAEKRDAEEEFSRYLQDRETATGAHYVGIATDGADFIPYELRDGKLTELTRFTTSRDFPRGLLIWLDTAVAVSAELPPDPDTVRRELGRDSLTYELAQDRLGVCWNEVYEHPEVALKRSLWANMLSMVYGSAIDSNILFFQHTYLTIVAKTMATRVLDVPLPPPHDLLAGQPFQDAGIGGAVESDFFDWILAATNGPDLVARIAQHASRFRLHDIQHDVLKVLYESLIDPSQRHELGEYYTPDWLAARMCKRVIDRPLEQRVLDPACGSGTFLFHAVRRVLEAADNIGMNNPDTLIRCCDKVLGVDVHPVACIIARVTYLLALGPERLGDTSRPGIEIPVYLGDSLQWNTVGFLTAREVQIEIPDGPTLRFPIGVAADPAVFDRILRTMLQLSEVDSPPGAMRSWLAREAIGDESERELLVVTYEAMYSLRKDGRNHIWGYVGRNLSRPVWLASQEQRARIILGNPPWLAYRHMSTAMRERFRTECGKRGLWQGGKVATHQDLSGYFFARCAELYVNRDGVIAFVMPFAALDRRQFTGFRTGRFETRKGGVATEVFGTVRFLEAWAFDETVQPLFPVPSCVIIATVDEPAALPESVTACHGILPRRDATVAEADVALRWDSTPWPPLAEPPNGSPHYRNLFRQGATILPRLLCIVELASAGRLGGDAAAPLLKSRRSRQENQPWRDLPDLRGRVEAEFLHPLYLGESIAPFRLLMSVTAVIPWSGENRRLLDADDARRLGYPNLARWLGEAEVSWRKHGTGGMSLIERWDYQGGLRSQMPPPSVRVLYAASGTLPAAAVLRDAKSVVEHGLYWLAVEDESEALYLCAILNSETARSRVASRQAKGQWGARHFDKVMFDLPIPTFDEADALHVQLATAASYAERIAGEVATRGLYFVNARRQIRTALREDGIAGRIDALVGELLDRGA